MGNRPLSQLWRLPAGTLLIVILISFFSLPASNGVTAAPAGVALVGSLQSELGCPGDWQPECAATELTDQGNGVWRGAFNVPAGSWEYKVALNDTWDVSYPAANVPLNLGAAQSVRFYYDDKTAAVLDNVNTAKIPVAAGSFQSELGCPGDWQPDCVRSLLTDPDGDGTYRFQTSNLPAGNYAFKVAFNEGWGNGEVPANDVPFAIASPAERLTISWNAATNEVTSQVDLPLTAALVGSLQSELGCPGDWQPECAATELADQGNGVFRGEFNIPAGGWEYKVALNDTWDASYPANNVALNLAGAQAVRFYYDDKTKAVHDNVNTPKIPVAAGSFQSEIGCPGDWQPACVRSLLTDADGDGIFRFQTRGLPAGSYAFKVAFNEGWGNGEVPANDVPFTIASPAERLTISWNAATNEVTSTVDLPITAAVAGNFQDELGCPGDWQPECAATELIDQGNRVFRGEFNIPAGSWEYKVALNDTWDVSYPANNISLNLAAGQAVRFYYDDKTKAVMDNVIYPKIPVAAGSFQQEIGCPGDWQPQCVQSLLTDADGDGLFTFISNQIPAGSYAFKVAFNEGWGNGEVPANDVPFEVTQTGQTVTISWNAATDAVGVTAGVPIDPALVADVIQDPIQDQVMYFVLPDRFANGDPSNDEGAAPGGTLAETGYLVNDKAFYHGGDFAGLQAQLPYLQGLGVTAMWITAPFRNQPTQADSSTAFGIGAGYHGYWILDYENADPHLGTNAELAALVSASQSLGIKVFFDIVVNHTADVIRYAEGTSSYRSKANFPYKDASGNPFDDRDYVGTGSFPPLDPATSFPYTPVFPDAAAATAKNPAWLNNPIYYHNRGDSSFSGENSLYGDFFGLDDLFTEHPDVVAGYIVIFKTVIDTYNVDGFRLDTVKHVNNEFWQALAPAVIDYARSNGSPEFTLFGEVFDGSPAFLSQYTTVAQLPSVLDFGLHGRAIGFAARSEATDSLRDLFAQDDYYTDADSNAYQLGNFISNHDIGRIGREIVLNNAGAGDAVWVDRVELAQALSFFVRGFPVIYYGDEQGFTGDGGDKDARQDMMPSQVPSYNDDNLIGTAATTADANFDATHPIYQTLSDFAALREGHLALRRGAQIHRFSEGAAGIYAFSRIEAGEKIEYLVLLNNAAAARSASFDTFSKGISFTSIYPDGTTTAAADGSGRVTVDVPALGVLILRADASLPADEAAAPVPTFNSPAEGGSLTGRVEVGVDLSAGDRLVEVTFSVKAGAADWEIVGTDNNAPYRVFFDVGDLPVGTPVSFQAIVKDLQSGKMSNAVVNATTADPTSTPAEYVIIHYHRPDGNYGDFSSSDFNDFWGLHLWGSALHPEEFNPSWDVPRKFSGVDDFGAYVALRLADPNQPVNFIVHRGNLKDPEPDRFFDPKATPEVWLMSGELTIYGSKAEALRQTRVHYNRPDGDYGDPTSSNFNDFWGLHLWQDGGALTDWPTPLPFAAVDSYGALYDINQATFPALNLGQPLNFIVHRGDAKDTDPDRSYLPSENYEIWLKSGNEAIYSQRGAAEEVVTIHYRRCLGDYGDATSSDYRDFWGLHTWGGATDPGWTTPRRPAGSDDYGIFFEVPLFPGADTLNYILHRGDDKDVAPDQSLDLAQKGYEIWIVEGGGGANLISAEQQFTSLAVAMNVAERVCAGTQIGNLKQQRGYWLAADTLAWTPVTGSAARYALVSAPDGGLALAGPAIEGGTAYDLTVDPAGLSAELLERFPHLAGRTVLKLDPDDAAAAPAILKGQIALAAFDGDGNLIDATGIQIPGVLDDLYTYDGDLGVNWGPAGEPTIQLWAPTAQAVNLHLFADADPATAAAVYPMAFDPGTGVWSLTGEPGWEWQYYLYEVAVFVNSTAQVERNMVTDPYSFSLSMNSARTQIVDLDDPALIPSGWITLTKPALGAPEDISIYEIHVRDFSANDPSVPDELKGTYKAFTLDNTYGINHLEALADAGLSHLHLLPVFDIATINEDKTTWQAPDPAVLATYPPDSDQQQAAVTATENLDAFNWGYDPFHYTTPEGSYSTDPNGPVRILEFREMVQALNQDVGLRVVVDVVYNHTNASGQNEKSVLDRIVPGYYHRLNDRGQVESSTCCANTATEHNMMEKLMIDSLLVWAKAYKVDAFRFDLMGHHMVRNMLAVRAALDSLTLADNGVDGQSIYIYGEGWNFGEVADNARGENATQLNLGGTGIGTFSDRLRDAVRGGGPFDSGDDLIRRQGFANGLYYDPNSLNSGSSGELSTLLLLTDQIRVGMAGNLAGYAFVDRNGNLVTGSQVDYNGQPAGYTLDPQEDITYISKHDNQTLYDNNVYKLPIGVSMADRVRVQNLGLATVLLGEGVPFIHAGADLLRSKSLDRDSFNSGDWFNRLDFTYQSSNFGVGLPVASKNLDNWGVMQPFLANPALQPAPADIMQSGALFRELLAIRYSSKLFRLETAADIQERLVFLNTGPTQIPGLIVMVLSDETAVDIDRLYEQIVVVINANDAVQTFSDPSLVGRGLMLHPVQRQSVDPLVRATSYDGAGGTIVVPGRTAAVFVKRATPTERLDFIRGDIQDLVAGGVLNAGEGNSLTVKLDAAIKKLGENQPRVAVNQLLAFVNQVKALVQSGRLTPAQGQFLIDQVRSIIAQINGG